MVGKPDVDRRTVLKSLGGAVGVGLVGGTGMMALSGGASATAGSSIDNPTAVSSDDGKITYVAVQTTGRLTWDGFDKAAKKARMKIWVKYKRDGSVFKDYYIHDTKKFDLTQSKWGSNGDETSLSGDHEAGQEGYIASDVDWGIAQKGRQHVYDNVHQDDYPLPNDPAKTQPLYATDDGSSKETRVILEAEYRLYDADGNELTNTEGYPDRPTHSSDFKVTVNNEASTTGAGDDDAQGDTDDTAEVGV